MSDKSELSSSVSALVICFSTSKLVGEDFGAILMVGVVTKQ